MAPEAVERRNVSLVGYHELRGRPGFKMGLQPVDGRWYLYFSHFWHSGWSILDVTDPRNPSFVSFLEGPEDTMTSQIQVADGTMITSLERPRANYGPVDDPMDPANNETEGAYIWDVGSDPEDPELLGHWATGGEGTHRNFYAGGRYAYMCAKPAEFEGALLSIVDIEDPTTPTEVSRWWWPGQSPDDVTDASEASYFHGPAYVRDDRAYLSYGRVGMVILDVSDRSDPELVSQFDFGALGSRVGAHSFVPLPDSDLAVANSEAILEASPLDGGDPYNYVFLVDISDERHPGFSGYQPTGPRAVTPMPLVYPEDRLPYDSYHEKAGRFGPHNHYHNRPQEGYLNDADLLYTTYCNAGLRIFDISNPLRPRETGYYVPEDPDTLIGTGPTRETLVTQIEEVLVDSRGYIYCTDPNHGVFILEYTGD